VTDSAAPSQAESSNAVLLNKNRSRLFLKYAGMFVVVVCTALILNGIFEI
jgi:hypothetical protein